MRQDPAYWKALLRQKMMRKPTVIMEKIGTVFKDAALTLVTAAISHRFQGCNFLEVGIPNTETTEIHVDQTLIEFIKPFLKEQMKTVGMAEHCEWV
jgi:hypothetical protein